MKKLQGLVRFSAGSGVPIETVNFADSGVLTQLQVVPELQAIILGHKNSEMVAPVLFSATPPVAKENGKFPYFGKDAWYLQDASRALRGKVQHPDVLNSIATYSLDEYSLGFMIDRRETEDFAGGKDQLMTVRTAMVESMLDVAEEYAAAYQATLTTNYPAALAVTGAGFAWASNGNPVNDILTQQDVIRQNCGQYGNTVVFDPKAWRLFRTNAIARSYAASYLAAAGGAAAPTITEAIAAQVLGVERVVVGKMVMADAAGTVSDIWSVNQAGNVIIARTGVGLLSPAYGLKIVKQGYPKAEGYWSNEHKSDVYDVQRIFQYKQGLVDSNGDFIAGSLIYSIA